MQPLGDGVITLGVPIDLGVIILTIAITGICVQRADGESDQLTRKIFEDLAKQAAHLTSQLGSP